MDLAFSQVWNYLLRVNLKCLRLLKEPQNPWLSTTLTVLKCVHQQGVAQVKLWVSLVHTEWMHGLHESVRIQRKASNRTKDECWMLWCLSQCTVVPLWRRWITAVFLSTTKNNLWHTNSIRADLGWPARLRRHRETRFRDLSYSNVFLSFLVHCSLFKFSFHSLWVLPVSLLARCLSIAFSSNPIPMPSFLSNFLHSPTFGVSLNPSSPKLHLPHCLRPKLFCCVLSVCSEQKYWPCLVLVLSLTSDSYSYSLLDTHSLYLSLL